MTENGFILIIVLILMLGVLVMGMGMADHLLIQSKIQHNLYLESKTYYLAQAGIEYATQSLAKSFSWRPQKKIIDHKSEGKILLQSTEDVSYIYIRSTGIYGQYTKEAEAIFYKNFPKLRYK